MHNRSLLTLLLVAILFVARVTLSQAKIVDPDAYRNLTEIIQAKGYPVETHTVETQDGYLLTVFRIPPKVPNSPPILLQHGVLDCAVTWIINYPKQSLAYILHDAGYDVFMANSRGNTYSKKHKTLSPDSKEFWEFSWDQMAQYDVPANIDYIINLTKSKKVSYIGHSQGTIQMFAALSANPQLSNKLYSYTALAPVVTVNHMSNFFFRALARMHVDELFKKLGWNQFMPTPTTLKSMFRLFCELEPGVCDNVIEFICGKHKGAFNTSRMSVISSHDPAGTSVQNIRHWIQMVKTGLFAKFDFGREGNIKHYNQTTPPLYDLDVFHRELVNFPVFVSYGGADELASLRDIALLLPRLSPTSTRYSYIAPYAHLDFVWAIDAHEGLYKDLLQFIANNIKP